LLVKTNTLVKLSGRPGLVSLGLCTVAGTALLLGAVVGLMLADLTRPSEPLVASAATAAPLPAPTAEPASITTGAIDTPRAPAAPDAPGVAPSAVLPATASVAGPGPAAAAARGTMGPQPRDGLPLDLDPRTAHALAALAPTGFVVDAGTFDSEPPAKALVAALAGLAAPVRAAPLAPAGGPSGWRVSAGPFADAATATATAAEIRRAVGLEPLIRTLEPGE
jgi:hypothetical protein